MRSYPLWITRHIQQISRFDEQRPPPAQEHPAAQIERDRQKSHADSDGQERGKQRGWNRGCGGAAFDCQHEGSKQNGQHGCHPLVLKQPHEPGKGGEDEEQLIEGQGKQRQGQPLIQIGRVIFRHYEPERRIQEQMKRGCDGNSGQGHGDEQSRFDLERKNRPMGVERMPRKDEAPQDHAAKENDGLQIPDGSGTVQPERQAGITRQGRDQ